MRVSKLPLLLATALVAAALGDAFVETIANSGMLGRGYSDNNHLSVIPAAAAGAGLLLIFVVMRCAQLLRRMRERHSPAPLFDVPAVFALQLATLFVMETVERTAYGGNVSFGTSWLGGPIWFSLLAHASLAYVCTAVATHLARSAAHRCAVLVAIALRWFSIALNSEGILPARRGGARIAALQRICVRHIGERAPPFLPALT